MIEFFNRFFHCFCDYLLQFLIFWGLGFVFFWDFLVKLFPSCFVAKFPPFYYCSFFYILYVDGCRYDVMVGAPPSFDSVGSFFIDDHFSNHIYLVVGYYNVICDGFLVFLFRFSLVYLPVAFMILAGWRLLLFNSFCRLVYLCL